MNNPFVYYRIDSESDLKRFSSYSIIELDWRKDLPMIQRFYARFNSTVNPDDFGPYVGSPLAIIQDGAIVCFAIFLSFREGETEIGSVATVPDQRNKGYCKTLLSENVRKNPEGTFLRESA